MSNKSKIDKKTTSVNNKNNDESISGGSSSSIDSKIPVIPREIVDMIQSNLMHKGSNLTIVYIDFDDVVMPHVCTWLIHFGTKLKVIDIQGSKITSPGATMLINALTESKIPLVKLYLSGNFIGDDCMDVIGEYVKVNKHLQVLYLSNNKVTDKGVEILSEYIIGNQSLKFISFNRHKGITEASLPYLADIAKMSHITLIDTSDTSISPKSRIMIDKALSIPIEQRNVPIVSNTKSAAKMTKS